MPPDTLQQRSDRFAARVEALAAALRDSGIREDAAARVLSRASTAVLQALALELILEEPRLVAAAPSRRPEPETRLEIGLRLAA
jgi:hypothetical protein